MVAPNSAAHLNDYIFFKKMFQVIPVTHFIDQSLIYGQNKQDMEKFKGKNGLLQVSEIDKRIFPKSNANPQAVCDIRQGDRGICFDAGKVVKMQVLKANFSHLSKTIGSSFRRTKVGN